jgi:predicted ATP-dependent endonuclease of OLD family
MTVPTVLRLKIDRFRGLKMVDWRPSAGLNLILGGGDVGKTTILDAVALLLSAVNPANLPVPTFTDARSSKDSRSKLCCRCRRPSVSIAN